MHGSTTDAFKNPPLRGLLPAVLRGIAVRILAPALCFQSFAIDSSPIQRQPLFLEEFSEHYVPILQNLDLDGHGGRKKEAAHVAVAAPQTPKYPRARMDDV